MTSVYFNFPAIRSVGLTFSQRVGPPDECTSALGHVTVGFSWLEQALERHICALSGLSSHVAPAITAELSFKVKVSVLSSLVRSQFGVRGFNAGIEDPKAVWEDIVKMLSTSEELRNQLIHSHWELPNDLRMRRTKTTAKASQGVRVVSEELTAEYLLDVYDYILNVEYTLDEYFLC